MPGTFAGAPFLGGSSFNDLTAWRAPGIANDDARHELSHNTCNGCHGAEETGTFFVHVSPRNPGFPAPLSGFLSRWRRRRRRPDFPFAGAEKLIRGADFR